MMTFEVSLVMLEVVVQLIKSKVESISWHVITLFQEIISLKNHWFEMENVNISTYIPRGCFQFRKLL